ncbi:deoxyribonuclease [Canid alphaherpesvirus 1]|nr:deoxyribonuclease [Canid alphaherpesvirus 1]
MDSSLKKIIIPSYKLRRLISHPYTSELRRILNNDDNPPEFENKPSLSLFEELHFFLPSILPPQISMLTFLNHFSKSSPLPKNDKRLNPLFYRLAYIYDLLKSMESSEIIGNGVANYVFGFSKNLSSDVYTSAKKLSKNMTSDSIRSALLFVEAGTREQSESNLWMLLRKGLATASTMKWGPYGPHYPPKWCEVSTNAKLIPDNPAMAFGRVNEPTVRSLITALYISKTNSSNSLNVNNCFIFDEIGHQSLSESYSCGLLIDVRTGVIGASLDMLVCDRNQQGILSPSSGQTTLNFFEIKCRAKYLFNPEFNSPQSLAYINLLKYRNITFLRKFIRSIKNPCIEYFNSNNVPGSTEALVTSNTAWRPRDINETKRRCGDFDKQHLNLNIDVSSDVWLFSEPNIEKEVITPLPWESGELVLTIPVFVNPRHANFKQILIQSYVLSGHFPERKLKPFLVTFIGRYRRSEEEGKTFTILDQPGSQLYNLNEVIPPNCAIPVIVIVTPILLDKEETWEDIELGSLEAFNSTADTIWDKKYPVVGVEETTS